MAKKTSSLSKKRISKSASGSLLKDRAYDRIKRSILTDEFGPGTFLSERQVASRLKMSKTPIKAAFERLEHEGFITVSPQQGVVVRDLNLQEIADHFELRETLEGYVVRNIAGRLTSEQSSQLRDNLAEFKTAVEGGEIDEVVRLDGEFHVMLCDFLGNHEFSRIMNELKDRISRVVRRVCARHADRPQAVLKEHRKIANLILKGDVENVANAMLQHLENGKQFLIFPRR